MSEPKPLWWVDGEWTVGSLPLSLRLTGPDLDGSDLELAGYKHASSIWLVEGREQFQVKEYSGPGHSALLFPYHQRHWFFVADALRGNFFHTWREATAAAMVASLFDTAPAAANVPRLIEDVRDLIDPVVARIMRSLWLADRAP